MFYEEQKAATLISSSIMCLFLVPDLVPRHKLSISFTFLVHTPSHFFFMLEKFPVPTIVASSQTLHRELRPMLPKNHLPRAP